MSNENKILIGIGVVTLALVAIAVFTLGGTTAKTEEAKTVIASEPKRLVREDSHKIGTDSAKVTLVEFGDYECPACGSTHPVISQLLNEYEGKVRFVFRQFPLTGHRHARVAANVVEAAAAQGKFEEMHNKIYEYQKDWSVSNNPFDEYFVKYAEQIKIADMEKFKKEVKEEKYKAKIDKDVEDGNILGVNSTPTFYINGEEMIGGAPYNEFKQKIDAAMKK